MEMDFRYIFCEINRHNNTCSNTFILVEFRNLIFNSTVSQWMIITNGVARTHFFVVLLLYNYKLCRSLRGKWALTKQLVGLTTTTQQQEFHNGKFHNMPHNRLLLNSRCQARSINTCSKYSSLWNFQVCSILRSSSSSSRCSNFANPILSVTVMVVAEVADIWAPWVAEEDMECRRAMAAAGAAVVAAEAAEATARSMTSATLLLMTRAKCGLKLLSGVSEMKSPSPATAPVTSLLSQLHSVLNKIFHPYHSFPQPCCLCSRLLSIPCCPSRCVAPAQA